MFVKSAIKRKSEEAKEHRLCHHEGCPNNAEYAAPKNPRLPKSYRLYEKEGYGIDDGTPTEKIWFCLEHIKKFNKNWDFFAGMSEEEVDLFFEDAVTGHRETYQTNSRTHIDPEDGYNAAWRFRDGEEEKAKEQVIDEVTNEKEAVKVLEISYPITKEKIKNQYRKLVKTHHPDTGGDEEQFKLINEAYHYLVSGL